MRKHTVYCQIESDIVEARKIVSQATNQFYIEQIQRILSKSGWQKEVQLELVDRIIDHIKKQNSMEGK